MYLMVSHTFGFILAFSQHGHQLLNITNNPPRGSSHSVDGSTCTKWETWTNGILQAYTFESEFESFGILDFLHS